MHTRLLNTKLKNWILLSFMIGIHVLSFGQNEQKIIIPGMYSMPETEIQNTDATKPSNQKSAKESVQADLHRFMGFENVPARYFSLPYDVMMNSNMGIVFTDVGFLLILILPILFLLPRKEIDEENNFKYLVGNFALMILMTMMMIISISSTFLNKNNFTHPEEGLKFLSQTNENGFFENFYQTITAYSLIVYRPTYDWFLSVSGEKDFMVYPTLILLFVLLFYFISNRIHGYTKITKALIFFLLVYMFFWWILGAGGPWYGILLFCVPYIFLVKGISFPENINSAPDEKSRNTWLKLKSGSLIFVCFFWVLMAFVARSTNYNPADKVQATNIYFPPILEYQANIINEKKLLDNISHPYREIKNIVNREEESLVYRVGTSINFFIKKNDTRVLNDTFLDSFNQLISKFKNKTKIIQALKASGYKFIILDLNLITSDKTPQKSLTKKFTQLMNTLYGNPMVELLITNRTIKLNSTGEVVNAVFQDKGTIVNSGNIALFRIK